jgi:DNA-binding transcriptional regulator YdaS (Cro superfamily)
MSGIEKALAVMAVREGVRPGGAEALAEALGVSQQAVSQWKAHGYVPPRRARQITELTGVPVAELVHPHIAELMRA